jgi:hypothetical protein
MVQGKERNTRNGLSGYKSAGQMKSIEGPNRLDWERAAGTF